MSVRTGKAASLFALTALFLATGATRLLGQASHSAKPRPPSYLESGVVVDGTYHDSSFAFTYKIPFGWVDRTQAMREADPAAESYQSGKALVRLAVFERPPEAPRSTINSGVVITLENQSQYPGLKGPVDYFGPLEQVTAAKGFKVVNEPYEFPVGPRMIAREDFSKEAGDATMHQSCLVMVSKGYIVLLTFVADSDDAMDELLQGLSWMSPQKSPRLASKPPKK